MSLLLSPAEMIELTEAKTRLGQIAWLKARGWIYEVGATGRPKVGADYARMRLGGGSTVAAIDTSDTQPDWSGLRAA